MPFDIPTLADMRRRSRDFITAQLPGSEIAPPNSRLRVLSDVNAATGHLNLLYLLWLSRQLMPDTAETEWLDRHGHIWLVNADATTGRKGGAYAWGTVTVTGTEGTALPSGTKMSLGDAEYQTIEEIIVGDAETPVSVVALQIGTASNRAAGETLALEDRIFGIETSAVVVSLTGGVDVETDEWLRQRVLERIRQPPMGGAAHDYLRWTKAVAGVTRAWVAPLEMGMGSVTVRFMMDDLRATTDPMTDGFPTAQDIATVKAYLDTVRPVAVRDYFVEAPIPEPINFTIDDLEPDTPAIRAAIRQSVMQMIDDHASPAYSLNGVAQEAQTIYAAWISEAILRASGVVRFTLIMDDHPMPDNGHLAVLGTITYE